METPLIPSALRHYTSASQRARVFSESWIEANFNCPNCSSLLNRTPNNTAAKDFTCDPCGYGFELKSKRGPFGDRVADGAYETMLSSIKSNARPHLLLLSYTPNYQVRDVTAIPRQFLIEEIVIPRNPLGPHCRRAGWQGCNLNLSILPSDARIECVSNFRKIPHTAIRTAWRKTEFLDNYSPDNRGWLAITMGLIRRLNKPLFTLSELYELEPEARQVFPKNLHIKAKLRQQLQLLRDKGWLFFEGRGSYRIANSPIANSQDLS